MAKRKEELLFTAEGEGSDGKISLYFAYKKGSSFYIVTSEGYRHLCHSSVRDREGIKQEISLVFQTKIVKIRLPWESDKPSS